MEYKITVQQINEIVAMLADCPMKFAFPVVRLLQQLIESQENQKKSEEAGNEMSQ